MSKNGKLLFHDFDPYITSPFGYRIHPITNVYTKHDGVDYGTNERKLPVYPLEDGVVVKTGYTSSNGNYVYINFKRLGYNALYQHLDKILVKEKEIVNQNTIIGYTGMTGASTGIHLHFGWFKESEQAKDWYSRNWLNFEEYNYVPKLKYLGNPVLRDINKKQIEVIVDELRVRKTPNGEILGYIKKGLYNVLDIKEQDFYTWYQIADDNWIAYNKDWEIIYEKEEVKEEIKEPDDTFEEEIIKNQKPNLFFRTIKFLVEIIKKILNIFKKS